MKILFLCFSTLEFNVRTPYEEPLGGTESALAYLSVALAKLGHAVFLMRKPKASELTDGTVIDGVTHLAISEDIATLDPDVVVFASAPQAASGIRAIVPRAKLVLWCHMRPDQPAMQHLFMASYAKDIDDIVYVSQSQEASFLAITGDRSDLDIKGTVINNAISPCFENMFSSAEEILDTKLCRGAYTSTPYRGLAVLGHIKELPISVYSSMRVYQLDDKAYEDMYAKLKSNDCLELKGSIPQKDLAEALRRTSFLVYPSIFLECHSIAILEAMAAGLKVVTTDVAYPQTEYVDSMPTIGGSLDAYLALLRRNMNFFRAHPEEWAEKAWKQVQYVNQEFTWVKKAVEWDKHLRDLCNDAEVA